MGACSLVNAARATLPPRRRPKQWFNIGVMGSWWRGLGDGFLYKGVKMRGELMAPLIPVNGWLEASDVYGFLNSALVPITIAGRENCEVRRPKMVVFVSSMRHHRGLKR